MSDTETLRDPSTLQSLDSFLEEEGMLEETTKAALNRITAFDLLKQFVSLQKVDPYAGWDLENLTELMNIVGEYVIGALYHDIQPRNFSLCELIVRGRYNNKGWNITALNRIAAESRKHLGLPSVEELNPGITKMKETLDNSRLFKRFSVDRSHNEEELETKWKIIAQDDHELPTHQTILPTAMIEAGVKAFNAEYEIGLSNDKDVIVAIFRAMCAASPRFDAVSLPTIKGMDD